MRILILVALILVIDWFSFQTLRFFVQESDRMVRLVAYGVFWLIPVLTLAFLFASMSGVVSDWPRNTRVIIGTIIMILYFSKLLAGIIIAIDDIRRLGVYAVGSQLSSGDGFSASRSKFLAQMSVALGALPFLSLTYGIIRNPYRYKVYRESVPIAGLHKDLAGLRIVQISDIHSGSFLLKEPVERSIEMINDLEPDLVVFTGDLVNSRADEMDDYIDVFSRIRSKYGVYSILGNHDYGDYHEWPTPQAKQANFEYLKEQHRKLGWDLMMNEHRVVPVGEARLGLIGVENFSASRRFHKYGDLDKSVVNMPPSDIRILLSHDPSHWKHQVTAKHKDIELTLSGHTHGFQFGIEIPGYLRWSPVQYVYKEWAGLYREEGQFLYVNRGLGYLGYPGRVGILPEITLLTLTPAD